jgi:hypothetical protein
MRSIQDYKARVRPDSETLGSASPFNIIAESLTLPNFTPEEVNALYSQHTEATGQIFESEALQKAWYWSEGQPWLVNALARQAVERVLANDYSQVITAQHINQAADNVMKRWDTHTLSLLERLDEPRVWRFIKPMLAMSKESALNPKSDELQATLDRDLQYCLDLGLVVKRDGALRPANPIYASLMSRYHNKYVEVPKEFVGKWMDATGIDMTGLLKSFQAFWAKESELYLQGSRYLETAPHGMLTAFLQKVVNAGASVIPEFANGLGYADIVVQYAGRNYPLELKIKDNQTSLAASQEQLLGYMDHLLVSEGWLLIFDRESSKSWSEKITWETVTMPGGRTIHIVGC